MFRSQTYVLGQYTSGNVCWNVEGKKKKRRRADREIPAGFVLSQRGNISKWVGHGSRGSYFHNIRNNQRTWPDKAPASAAQCLKNRGEGDILCKAYAFLYMVVSALKSFLKLLYILSCLALT